MTVNVSKYGTDELLICMEESLLFVAVKFMCAESCIIIIFLFLPICGLNDITLCFCLKCSMSVLPVGSRSWINGAGVCAQHH